MLPSIATSGAIVLLHGSGSGASSGDAAPFIYLTMGLIAASFIVVGLLACCRLVILSIQKAVRNINATT